MKLQSQQTIGLECPHCLSPLGQCPETCPPLPRNFESICQDAPPLWLISAGFSKHGKTVFLSSLTMLMEQLSSMIPGFSVEYLDQYTIDKVREMRERASNAEVASPTQLLAPSPLLIRTDGAPDPNLGSTSRTLFAFDTPGEFFQDLEQLLQNVPAVTNVESVWFLVSLKELKESQTHFTLRELFASYRSAIEQADADLQGRNLVVTYTMADAIKEMLPNEALAYLDSDPFKDLSGESTHEPNYSFDFPAYMKEAEQISSLLQEFTRQKVPGGRDFCAAADRAGIKLRFCTCSSLGHGADESGMMPFKPTTHRVLDPLFWTLWLQGNNSDPAKPNSGRANFRFLLDASKGCDPIFEDGLPGMIWNSLSRRGHTSSHFLGKLRPVGHANQPSPDTPPRKKMPRLIGPIIDRLSQESRFDQTKILVLTNGPLLDGSDFIRSSWRDRILVVVTRPELEDIWPHTYVLRDGEDSRHVVEHLLRLTDTRADFF